MNWRDKKEKQDKKKMSKHSPTRFPKSASTKRVLKIKINYLDNVLKRLFFFQIIPEYSLPLENIQNNSTRSEAAAVRRVWKCILRLK